MGWPYYILKLPYLSGFSAENADHPERRILVKSICDNYLQQYRDLYEKNTLESCINNIDQMDFAVTVDFLRVPHYTQQFIPLTALEMKHRMEYFTKVNVECGYTTDESHTQDILFQFHNTPMGRILTGDEHQPSESEDDSSSFNDDVTPNNFSRISPFPLGSPVKDNKQRLSPYHPPLRPAKPSQIPPFHPGRQGRQPPIPIPPPEPSAIDEEDEE